ncbi:MAG: OpcA protein [Actinobacteria bacterium]|nr:OpcA protein [Actinomycetota bacterium]
MIIRLENTTSAAVAARLVTVREEGGVVALGRVLTLIVLAHGTEKVEEAIEITNAASREHPSRVIVVNTRAPAGRDGLDAEIRVGGDAGASEVVVLHPRGAAAVDQDTLVTPLLLPDTPIVAFWVGRTPHKPAAEPVGRMAQRRITDIISGITDDPATSREARLSLALLGANYAPGDTDLSWARITLWRALIASVLDLEATDLESIDVEGAQDRPSMHLLAGWIRSRLGVPVRFHDSGGIHITRVDLNLPDGTIRIARPTDATAATISRAGKPDQRTNLPPRTTTDCLMEELRRLDADEVYAEALARAVEEL